VPLNSLAPPATIHANQGIARVLFFRSDETCATSCRDKNGKHQAQIEVTLPRI